MIADVTLTEQVASISLDCDMEGNPLCLKDCFIAFQTNDNGALATSGTTYSGARTVAYDFNFYNSTSEVVYSYSTNFYQFDESAGRWWDSLATCTLELRSIGTPVCIAAERLLEPSMSVLNGVSSVPFGYNPSAGSLPLPENYYVAPDIDMTVGRRNTLIGLRKVTQGPVTQIRLNRKIQVSGVNYPAYLNQNNSYYVKLLIYGVDY